MKSSQTVNFLWTSQMALIVCNIDTVQVWKIVTTGVKSYCQRR
jgi:hypothetical protein